MQPPDSDNLPQVQTESKGECCFGQSLSAEGARYQCHSCWIFTCLLLIQSYQFHCARSLNSLKRTDDHSVHCITGYGCWHTAVYALKPPFLLRNYVSIPVYCFFFFLSNYFSDYPHIYLSVCLPARPSINVIICLSSFNCLSVSLCLYNWLFWPFVCLSI